MASKPSKPVNGTPVEWELPASPTEPELPRCPRCDAAINVERVSDSDYFVSDCCGKPFRWPPLQT